ncbi:hypothetical protein B0H14DRAFT_2637875 [Mycena olivaceomarginata]|nr:hypothetical protein B0H14DRAFT_2637875 [Mycena olivaceomarginata]
MLESPSFLLFARVSPSAIQPTYGSDTRGQNEPKYGPAAHESRIHQVHTQNTAQTRMNGVADTAGSACSTRAGVIGGAFNLFLILGVRSRIHQVPTHPTDGPDAYGAHLQ